MLKHLTKVAQIGCLSLFFFLPSRVDAQLMTDQKIRVAGVEREYHLFVPDDHHNAPIVFLFHGHTNTSDELIGLSGTRAPQASFRVWLDIAKKDNVILAIPNGRYVSRREKGWNDCRADAPTNSKADDVLFISKLLDSIVDEYQANPQRVYATGHSNGGHFAIRLAQEIPEKITAFAAISASHAANSECKDSTIPVSALVMNGTADRFLPYSGGPMLAKRGDVLSTAGTLHYWIKRNGTDPFAEMDKLPDTTVKDKSRAEKYTYKNGINNTEVVLFRILNGGHTTPSIQVRNRRLLLRILGNQNADIEMADEVWSFFKTKKK